MGAPKQEEEKGASCLLSPVGRDWSWPGKHGVADTESIGTWWWEMFSLSRDRKLLLYWATSGLSPRGHLERQAEFHASTQDEA